MAALALGALSGLAMRPDLFARDDRPRGPQMFADWVGEGTTGPFDGGTTFEAAYRTAGPVPDYVYGTDRTRGWANAEPEVTRVRYDQPRNADDAELNADDDTTVAERDPNNPSREPAYDNAPARDSASAPSRAPAAPSGNADEGPDGG